MLRAVLPNCGAAEKLVFSEFARLPLDFKDTDDQKPVFAGQLYPSAYKHGGFPTIHYLAAHERTPMMKEPTPTLVMYIIAVATISLASFMSAYKTVAPFFLENSGNRVGEILAIQVVLVSCLIGLVALARLIVVIKQRGIRRIIPHSSLGMLLRNLSLFFLYAGVVLNAIAYGLPIFLFFQHLFPPVALGVVLFEASRLFAFESLAAEVNIAP